MVCWPLVGEPMSPAAPALCTSGSKVGGEVGGDGGGAVLGIRKAS